jgi:hypothetical protein
LSAAGSNLKPMKKLREERIIKKEEAPLDDSDILSIKEKRKRQIKIAIPALLLLAGSLIYMAINGLAIVQRRRWYQTRPTEFNDEKREMYYTVLPYVIGFFALMLIGFSIYHYLKMINPLIKDLKSNKKLLLHFIPEKTDMGMFQKYYISTPVFAKQQIQISKEDFDWVVLGDHMIVETTYCSNTILHFTFKERKIEPIGSTLRH